MSSTLDLMHELRLRRWARHNYVAAEERFDDWHPVILEEMRQRDREMADAEPVTSPGARYVPLDPGEFTRIDEAAEAVPAPKFLAAQVEASSSIQKVA